MIYRQTACGIDRRKLLVDALEVSNRRNDARTDLLEIPGTPRIQPGEEASLFASKVGSEPTNELSPARPWCKRETRFRSAENSA